MHDASAAARASALADLSIEELTQISITSVSRRPEPLATAPSAIQLVTGEEIRRSTATLLPEALRLASNLQVARLSSNDWAITARGFSGASTPAGSLSNKLQVMIDGRAIYSPVFGGVFWDVNNVLLEDVERIESVSGPGATLWGANAVNGVIHVIRKHAADTQGWYGSVTGGAEIEDYALRYGGRIGERTYFRVYGQRLAREALSATDRDEWTTRQGGFRIDYSASAADTVTLQGDFYNSTEGLRDLQRSMQGQNLLGAWRRRYAEQSELLVTAYVDRRSSDRVEIDFELDTYDVDVQHSFPVGDTARIVWGGNYRLMRDETRPGTAAFVPSERTMHNINVFAQGEFALIPERLAMTVGAKAGDNEFSGFETQPSVRLAWTPSLRHMLWTAVSRAVRTPSRFDVDLQAQEGLEGNPDFRAERVIAYEVGYRTRPTRGSTLSFSTFYNDYRDVRSLNINPDPPPELHFDNDFKAKSWGLEVFGMLALTEQWRLRGFYTYFDSRFTAQDALVVPNAEAFEATDPRHQISLHSMMDLPYDLQLDLIARRVTSLSGQIPSYNALDARLAWRKEHWEVALMGQNLNGGQREFGNLEIPRSVFAKLSFWY